VVNHKRKRGAWPEPSAHWRFPTLTSPPVRRVLAAFTVLAATTSVLVGAGTAPAVSGGRGEWVGSWATAITRAGTSQLGFDNQTIRMTVHLSVGGDAVRIRLANNFGTQAAAIGKATVGVPTAPASADIVPGTVKTLTFQGSESATMLKGADLLSDPVKMDVPAGSDLVVSVFFPTPSGPAPFHLTARQTVRIYAGDHTTDVSGAGQTSAFRSSFFIAGVDVLSRRSQGAVVVLGDSISDGNGSTVDANTRWPDFLAARTRATPQRGDDVGVLNEALAGNRVNHDGTEAPLGFEALGLNGLARLDSDVYGQTGVETVILELGVNDDLFSVDPADKIIAGLKQLNAQLKNKGLRVLACTLVPFNGFSSPEWTPEKETIRQAVNAFIRGSHDFNGVVDIDKVLRDPADPTKLRAEFDSGDHIHPNDAGSKAIADAVPLNRL
jgi:lysophospholipase L1-like esterase